MENALLPCPGCQRHIRTSESTCPFCAKHVAFPRVTPVRRARGLSRAALYALGTSLGANLGACDGSTVVPIYGVPATGASENGAGGEFASGGNSNGAGGDFATGGGNATGGNESGGSEMGGMGGDLDVPAPIYGLAPIPRDDDD